MKRFIVNHVWWITLLLGLGMLAAHTFSFDRVKVDNTSIILLVVILLSPFVSAITRIKYGDFEAEIDPKEVQKIKNEVSAQTINADEPAQDSDIEETINSLSALVESDPILALAKLRIELEKALNRLFGMTHKEDKAKRVVSPMRLIHSLSSEDILPKDIAQTTREVMLICNRAIHGEDIRKQDAETVVESGASLLITLRSYARNYVLEPIETVPIDKSTLDEYWGAQYRVTSIIPLSDTPYKNVRILDQEGLDGFLEGYNEYAEFVVEVKKHEPKE
jgi:hypothetical protein